MNKFFDANGHLNDTAVLLSVKCWRAKKNVPEDIKAHLEKCKHCKEEVLEYRLFEDDQIGMDVSSPYMLEYPTGEKKKGSSPIMKIAAVLLLFAAFSWVIFELTNSNNLSEEQKSAWVAELKRDGDLPFYDRQIEERGSVRGEEMELLSPGLDTVLIGNSVMFVFSKPHDSELSIEVFTKASEENPLVYKVVQGEVEAKLSGLKMGLYYWRVMKEQVEGRNERLTLGRFYLLNNSK